MSAALALELMKDDAVICNRRRKLSDKALDKMTTGALHTPPIERRASKLCQACGNLVRPENVVMHGSDATCGAAGCLDGLRRWRRL